MDPTTTLFTFMLQTHPSVKAVNLIGSWDNFTTPYTMERDSRRARGMWRGCYTFKDITREGDTGSIPKRTGGLKMGHTYYYYYELDGTSETHDPSQPSTNTCPYLPGQTVNTLWIPVEQSLRKRSASLTSLRDEDFKTMDPTSKFVAPRPAPTPPEPARRIGTAPLRPQQQKRPSRSPSPSSRWIFSPRKLFSRKSSSSSLRDPQNSRAEDERSLRSDGSRSRDISPESLRRFLVDDTPLEHDHHEASDRPTIDIPEDIVEENEDDDNFATSAVSETMEFTGLSPPPPRALSPAMSMASMTEDFSATFLTVPPAPTRPAPRLPALDTARTVAVRSDFPLSAFHPQHRIPESPDSNCPPEFDLSDDEDEDEEDDDTSGNDEDSVDGTTTTGRQQQQTSSFAIARHLTASLSTYSLPRTAGTESEKQQQQQQPRAEEAGPLLLTSAIPDAGLGELVSELGWMADVIRGEY